MSQLQAQARSVARRNGHSVAEWFADSAKSAFAFCIACGLAATVTLENDDLRRIDGSTQYVRCAGEGTVPAWREEYRPEPCSEDRRTAA